MSEHEPPEGGLGGAADAADDPSTAAALRTLAPLLRDPAVWTEPPPLLGDSIVAAIAAERTARAEAQIAPTAAEAPAAETADELSRARARRADRRRPAFWATLASAAAVLAIAVGIVAVRDGDDGGEQLALSGSEIAPNASASATITEFDAGVAIELDVEGLPPAPDGQYYAGWVRSEAGELVGVGSFHMRGGDAKVTLWSGVALADYPILSVTIQTEGEGESSSGQVVLRGTLVD